jgi:hypothetical protein
MLGMTAWGSDSVIRRCLLNVWITPESGRRADIGGCLKGARTGLMRRSKQQLYSMTSSARPTRCFTINIPAERRVFGKSFGSTRKLKTGSRRFTKFDKRG